MDILLVLDFVGVDCLLKIYPGAMVLNRDVGVLLMLDLRLGFPSGVISLS